jgi:hypothetical protein
VLYKIEQDKKKPERKFKNIIAIVI